MSESAKDEAAMLDAIRAENARLRDALVYISNVCINYDKGDEAGRALGHIADHTKSVLEMKQ